MKEQLRVLEAHETGKGILVEHDAGYISPNHPENEKVIMESKSMRDHSKPFIFYAVLQKFDTPNRNGRLYPEKILKREAENYKRMIQKGTSLSELNHPESSIVDLERVSHIIDDVWWDGNTLMGKLRLLTSPAFHETGIVSTPGDIAANLMRQGVTMGVSSRGVGSLVKQGEQNEVQGDFELICFDLVSSPSTPGAYLYLNKEDRPTYEEKLEENNNVEVLGSGMDKSVDLMKRLSDYLGK
jgi:hypothetical protein